MPTLAVRSLSVCVCVFVFNLSKNKNKQCPSKYIHGIECHQPVVRVKLIFLMSVDVFHHLCLISFINHNHPSTLYVYKFLTMLL